MYLRHIDRHDMRRFYISNHGNIDGINEEKQGTCDYIVAALNLGFDVAINVWSLGDQRFAIGVDKPDCEVEIAFVEHERMWCRAQDLCSLYDLIDLQMSCKVFYPEFMPYSLVNVDKFGQCWIWTQPRCGGMESNPVGITDRSILFLPEDCQYNESDIRNCQGVCSNIISKYKNDEIFNEKHPCISALTH